MTLALLILALVGILVLIMVWLARITKLYGWLCLLVALAALTGWLMFLPEAAVRMREGY